MTESVASFDKSVREISLAWREMRRGASLATLRQRLLGDVGCGIEQTQYDTLEILASPAADEAGWRMGDLAERLYADASTSTRTIDRLVASGWVERGNLGGDRRVVIVALTKSGRALIDAINAQRLDGMRRLLAPFTDDEVNELARLLTTFVGSMDSLVTELESEPDPD